MPKLKRREAWGRWEDRSATLVLHPLNQKRPGYIYAAHVNAVLSVQASEEETAWGYVTHLWIKRHDGKPVTWAEMQRVKNELAGEALTAIEVYPPVDQLVDEANMYHLWVLPSGFKLPFSLKSSDEDEVC